MQILNFAWNMFLFCVFNVVGFKKIFFYSLKQEGKKRGNGFRDTTPATGPNTKRPALYQGYTDKFLLSFYTKSNPSYILLKSIVSF